MKNSSKTSFYQNYGKRVFDLSLAIPALIVSVPVIGVAALMNRWKLGKPVLFRQQRPGKNEVPFVLFKFRSMTQQRGSDGKLLSDGQRLGMYGKLLRKTSVDELPSLWNVIRGDLSLVGPRPLLMQYIDRYNLTQRRRHEVSPGITGWAQVHGRNSVPWEQRLALDVWYVDNVGFWLDLRILCKTVWLVVRRKGISADSSQTMPEFMGDKK